MTEPETPHALRYPIGAYEPPEVVTPAQLAAWIDDIERLPGDLRRALAALPADRLDTPYREGGWTVRQVVHHLADSHGHCLIRCKWALTEDEPTIKPYDEARTATLDDYTLPVELSLDLLDALHARWVALLRTLTPAQLERGFVHPESGPATLAVTIGAYAWHGRHHLAHVMRVA